MTQEQLLAQLKREALTIDAEMRLDLAAIASPLLQEIVNHAIFAGGKRIRPLLTILAARLCRPAGHEEPPRLHRLAIAFEYLHAASLLHDDVIDHAEQRRGQATANLRWGNAAVILAGDFLHARALALAGTLGGVSSLAAIGNATMAMVDAEFLQMATAANRDRAEANYFQILEGKTAALIGAACQVGAIAAGGNEAQQQALVNYGRNLGLAFQVIDDLLDYQGVARKTGKAVGNDFQEGKMTLPLIHTLSQARREDREFLLALLAGPAAERPPHFPAVHALMERYGSFLSAREKAEELIRDAGAELAIFPASPEQEILHGLGRYVLTRDR